MPSDRELLRQGNYRSRLSGKAAPEQPGQDTEARLRQSARQGRELAGWIAEALEGGLGEVGGGAVAAEHGKRVAEGMGRCRSAVEALSDNMDRLAESCEQVQGEQKLQADFAIAHHEALVAALRLVVLVAAAPTAAAHRD